MAFNLTFVKKKKIFLTQKPLLTHAQQIAVDDMIKCIVNYSIKDIQTDIIFIYRECCHVGALLIRHQPLLCQDAAI